LNNLAALARAALRSINGKDPQYNDEGNAEEDETMNEEDGPGDWVDERENEILRLEHENTELRRALGISPDQDQEHGIDIGDKTFSFPHHPSPRSSPLRDDPNSGGGGRIVLAPARRTTIPNFNRRGPGEAAAARERVSSPPNDI
jgi:hypothetical protein